METTPDGQHLTGKVTGPIVDAKRKADLLMTIAQLEGVDLSQVIAVGDGANDLLMLDAAGLGIAFNAKPKVQKLVRFFLFFVFLFCFLFFVCFLFLLFLFCFLFFCLKAINNQRSVIINYQLSIINNNSYNN